MTDQIHSLGNNHRSMKCYLKTLRSLIEEDGNLSCPKDEWFLVVFLRAKSYDVHRSFKLLKNYWKARLDYPEMYGDLRLSQLEHVFSQQSQNILKHRDQHGHRIFIFKPGNWNPKLCSWNDVFRANLCCIQRLASEEQTQKTGIIAIVDMSNVTMEQVRHFTPKYATNICKMIQGSFPLKFRGIHVVNESWLFNFVFSLVWPFLKEKMRSRIHIHGNRWDSLHSHVDCDSLPTTYGGTLPETDNSAWVAKLKNESYPFDFFEP